MFFSILAGSSSGEPERGRLRLPLRAIWTLPTIGFLIAMTAGQATAGQTAAIGSDVFVYAMQAQAGEKPLPAGHPDVSSMESAGGAHGAKSAHSGKSAHSAKSPHGGMGASPHAGLPSSKASPAKALLNHALFTPEAGLVGGSQRSSSNADAETEHLIMVAESVPAAKAPAPGGKAKAADAAADSKAKVVRPAPDDPEGRYYVGSEPCKVCHAYLFDEFKFTVMGRNFEAGKDTPKGKMDCETCHGPASGHVNGGGGRLGGGIRSFRKSDPRTSVADTNGVCLQCHEKNDRTYWKGSTHETRDVACTDCHTVMRKTSPRFQLAKGTVQDTCFQCHKDRRAQSLRTAHMPMIEGKISCSSCHNPHGSASETAMLKEATVNDTCYQCHADKRGPFLFEHPPVRENCMNCHEPHGSMHNSLLVVSRPRLCQRCHTAPHDVASLGQTTVTNNNRRIVSQACQNCHTNIHGSNAPSGSRWHR
ncbi:decaheme c-type cytochrome, DmsE family [Rhodomicrobium vannielii ATCC 17100]|uniref:Decaheme c-type cytochrome, DmsE family n=1 Tax=Rhodomicrobium vannielii (strain ATCC 17100 / DSM 162 / LMG 4299 / NCIMB 10020 / ATH 3.1.1) TaxID=648757 RepID=E3I1N3_RHOVT|nr:DmsE family decaheme c-type cytochrome [Rhodomicrobium vannielii]ADP72408.1 decaheme c-type cytochrome, DmsE family [Rhodomicrobium vannielii ATCC 17100]